MFMKKLLFILILIIIDDHHILDFVSCPFEAYVSPENRKEVNLDINTSHASLIEILLKGSCPFH